MVLTKEKTPKTANDPITDIIDWFINAGMWLFSHPGITVFIVLIVAGLYLSITRRRKRVASTGMRFTPLVRQWMDFLRFIFIDDIRPFIAKLSALTLRTLGFAVVAVFIVLMLLTYDIAAVTLLLAFGGFAWQRYRPVLTDRERAVGQMWDIANTAFRFPKGAELNKRGYIIIRKFENLVTPKVVIVMYRASANAGDPAKQQSFESHFNAMAASGTAWDYQWEPQNNRVIITAQPPLPAMAPYPFPSVLDYKWDEFPLGIGVGDKKVVWEPAKVPHCIVAGKSGSGKSVLQRNILIHALQSPNWKLILVDPKRVELSMYKNGKNVLMYAVDDESMTEALEFALAQMKDRYALMESLGVAHYMRLPDKPHALLIMVDEATSLMKATGDKDVDELKKRNKAIVGTIAREGRAAGVHLVLATQRPDADVLGGDTRSTIEARVAMGGLDDTASRMILGNDMATMTPSQPRGRGVFGDGSTFTSFQSYYFDEGDVPHAVEISGMILEGKVTAEKVASAMKPKIPQGVKKSRVRLGFMDKLEQLSARIYPSDEELTRRKAEKKASKQEKRLTPPASNKKVKKAVAEFQPDRDYREDKDSSQSRTKRDSETFVTSTGVSSTQVTETTKVPVVVNETKMAPAPHRRSVRPESEKLEGFDALLAELDESP